MPEIIIKAENISKLYQLGTIGTGSLRRDMTRWWQNRVLKKEDPFFKAGGDNKQINKNYLWALKNISFEIKEGETWGIIGHNGAGKSTFLKILSRIVRPTEGVIRGKGKVSSLLEVGTGFHQELTGRENIFISGYMLGMKKQEILQKFDQIVAFSGIEAFLDTPVKRYSSGMYVRLAFSVAAHLEPDILIVDEVLAVGDADFQKKCMGKMKDISNTVGRTIVFVSHNLQAISNLCDNALWLDKGKIKKIGKAADVVNSYISSSKGDQNAEEWEAPEVAPGNQLIKMKSINIKPQTNEADAFITVRTPIEMNFEFWCFLDDCDINVNVILHSDKGECVFNLGTPGLKAQKAILGLKSVIPANLLNNCTYLVSLSVVKNNTSPIYEFTNCLTFDVEDIRENMHYFGTWPGIIRPQIDGTFYIKQMLNGVPDQIN
ncbi:MAG: ABC transporter ATP-binding protein [Ginsengibacter sp.]